jgi:hypothetical protein
MRNKLSHHTEYLLNCSIMGRDPNPDSRRQEKMEMWDEIEVAGARRAGGRKTPPKINGQAEVVPQSATEDDGRGNDHDDVNNDNESNDHGKEKAS